MRAGERKLWRNRGVAETTCRLLLVRHATAEGNGRFQGHLDVPLTSAGRRELQLLCEKCSRYPVRAVYSSDLRRARQTADAIVRNFGLDVEVRPELREIHFGQWEGLSWNQIARRFPRLATLWIERFPLQTIPGGEPLRQFRKRIESGIREIVEANQGQCALIVTHAGVIRFTLGKALGLPTANLFRLAQVPCAINVIDFLENGAIVRCING
jgi:broad specificity phosphatase PhoE